MMHPAVYILIALVPLVILMIGFALHRASTSHFICPRCTTNFQVRGFKYLVTPKTVNTHFVRCPHCGYEAFMEVQLGKK